MGSKGENFLNVYIINIGIPFKDSDIQGIHVWDLKI